MHARSIVFMCLAVAATASQALAQTRYELSEPGLNRSSQAILTESELRIIDQTGRETVYLRDPTADPVGGTYWAYRSAAAGQVIRWPATGRGPMQIGTLRGGAIEFRTSRMQVIPREDRVGAPVQRAAQRPVPPLAIASPSAADPLASDFFAQVWLGRQAPPTLLRLGIRDERGQEWFLGHAGGHRLAMFPAGRTAEVDWLVVSFGRGYIRLQHRDGADWLALAVGPGNRLAIDHVAQDARQLWRVVRANGGPAGYWLESAFAPGLALSCTPGGAVSVLPIGVGWQQIWQPLPPPEPAYEPLWRTVSQDVTPNPPLEPAQIDLLNSHAMPIVILIGDRRTHAVRPVRVEPGAQVPVTFDRDAGVSLVEVYETRSRGGVWNRQELVTQIPPATIYDLSVYEEFVQSIAIDRTGTSPNPIEDISVLPKSVGMILVPPGTALPARGHLDVYAQASAAGNPGAVRRWDPKTFDRPPATADPIQEALQSVAPAPAPPRASDRQKF